MNRPYYSHMPFRWSEEEMEEASKLGRLLHDIFLQEFKPIKGIQDIVDSIFLLFPRRFREDESTLKMAIEKFIVSSDLIKYLLNSEDVKYGISVRFDDETMSGNLKSLIGGISIEIMVIRLEQDPLFHDRLVPTISFEKGKMYFSKECTDSKCPKFSFIPMFDNFVKVNKCDSDIDNRY